MRPERGIFPAPVHLAKRMGCGLSQSFNKPSYFRSAPPLDATDPFLCEPVRPKHTGRGRVSSLACARRMSGVDTLTLRKDVFS